MSKILIGIDPDVDKSGFAMLTVIKWNYQISLSLSSLKN
jgi:hypothetical protein